MNTYDIWAEGYVAQGNSDRATLLAKGVYAENFDDACHVLSERNSEMKRYMRRHTDGSWTHWGCRLFPDESSARISFG